jgi:hypothetical protein
MNDKSIDNYLRSVEKEYSDELDCVLFYDLNDYTTGYLYELRDKCENRQVLHRQVFKKLIWLGAVSPLWLIIGMVAAFATNNIWLPKIILLFPISVAFFLFGLFKLHRQFGGMQKQEYIGRVIETEISRRNRSYPSIHTYR